MRFYGKLIATVGGHTKNSPVIVDRMVEAYVTKTKVKMYLFESDYKYWHKNGHILDIVEVAINKRPIKDIVTEQINNLATKNEINFENLSEKFGNLK